MNKIELIENINKEISTNKINKVSSLYLSYLIGYFLHLNQYRANAEPYFNHPIRMYNNFINLISIKINNKYYYDNNLLNKNKIHILGISEIILLHDTLEDSDIKDIAIYLEIYNIFNLKNYFIKYIATPLTILTHNKKESYDIYINKVKDNFVASLVKSLDLYDNLNILTSSFVNKEDKLNTYLKYALNLTNYHKLDAKFINYHKELISCKNKNDLVEIKYLNLL